MPSLISRTNAQQTNITGNNFISSGLVCHYDAWVKSSPTKWDDLTGNGFHITGTGINTVTLSNDPGVGVAYKSTGSGSYIILPNINLTNLFTTVEETIEMYIYPQSNNSVWFTETSNGVNSGWHIAKIVLYNGNFYAYKWNNTSDPPACLLGKAYLNQWNHVVWRQVNTPKMDGYLNGSKSSFIQTNTRVTPWINNGATTSYVPCMAYDSSTYGTSADPSGYVSLIRIYNRALTDSEILQNYNIFKKRNYLSGQNANNEPPTLLYYGNAGGEINQNYWGYWVPSQEVFDNYNVNKNIGVDFDFYFYGTNYGRGLNGSIWINAYGALAFGTSATTNDWQPANGKALLLGWNNTRRVLDGFYSNHLSQPFGYSERAFTYKVRNSNSYTYVAPYTTYFGGQYGNYYYFNDYTYWYYTIRLLKTNNYQYIDVRCTSSGNTQGRWQLCDGNSLTNINALVGGQSMVLVSDALGNNWTVYNPYYINDGMGFNSDIVNTYNVFMRYDANMLSKYYAPGDVVPTWANCGNINFIDMTATSYGSPTLSRTGRNFWVNFSANNQYFQIPQFNTNWILSSGGFTIAYSAYYSNPGSYSWGRIIDFGNGTEADNIGLGKYGTGTQMGFFINNNSTRLLTSYSPTNPGDGNWHVVILSVACITNSITVTWYDNSTSGTSYTYTGNTITEKNSYKNYIGKSNWTSDASFIGGMQEIIIFKGALNSSDCSSVMNYLKNKWQL